MVHITYIPNFTEICQLERMLRWSKKGNFNYNHPVHSTRRSSVPLLALTKCNIFSEEVQIGTYFFIILCKELEE